MEILGNNLKEFLNPGSLFWDSLIIFFLLLSILISVLIIGWRVNNKNSRSVEDLLILLETKYKRGQIPRKEYEDIKNEIIEPWNQLKDYLK